MLALEVLDALPLAVVLLDREHRIAAWNAAAADVSGHEADAVL